MVAAVWFSNAGAQAPGRQSSFKGVSLPRRTLAPSLGRLLCGTENLPAFDLTEHATKRRVPFAIWVTLWAIIVIAALALIITVVAWFAIP